MYVLTISFMCRWRCVRSTSIEQSEQTTGSRVVGAWVRVHAILCSVYIAEWNRNVYSYSENARNATDKNLVAPVQRAHRRRPFSRRKHARLYIYIIIIYVQYTSVHNTPRVFLPTRFFFLIFMEELNGRFTGMEGGSGGWCRETPRGNRKTYTVHTLYYIYYIRHKYVCIYIYIIMYMNESENIHWNTHCRQPSHVYTIHKNNGLVLC